MLGFIHHNDFKIGICRSIVDTICLLHNLLYRACSILEGWIEMLAYRILAVT